MDGYVLPIQNDFVKITNLIKQNATKFGTAKTLFLLVKNFQNRYTKRGIFRGKNCLGRIPEMIQEEVYKRDAG